MTEKSSEDSSKEAIHLAHLIRPRWKYMTLKYAALIVAIPLLAKIISSPAFLILLDNSPSASLRLYWSYLRSRDVAISEILSGQKFCAVGRYDSFHSSDFSNAMSKAERDASDADLTNAAPFAFSDNTVIVKAIGHGKDSGAFLSRIFNYGGFINHEKKGGCVGEDGFIRIEKRNTDFYLLIGENNGTAERN